MHKFKISKFISIIKLNIYYFFPIDGITFDKNLNGKFRFFYDKRIDGSTIYSLLIAPQKIRLPLLETIV